MKLIEHLLKAFYDSVKKQIPGLHNLSFDLIEYSHRKGVHLHGCWQAGNECTLFDTLDELIDMVSKRKDEREKREILFRKFN